MHGFPAGRATYDVHPHEVVASRYYGPKLEAIMREAGAESTFAATSPPLDGDRAGAAQRVDVAAHHGHVPHGRRSRARASSIAWQRFHDVENMVCTDSSVFPTSTGYGPTLTIVALAIRACREPRGAPAADERRGPHVSSPPMDLAALSDTSARRLAPAAPHRLGDLWDDQPVVLVFLRHFG